MVSQRRIAQGGVLAVAIVFFTSMGLLIARTIHPVQPIATEAPDFELTDRDGQLHTLTSLRGNAVVLLFTDARFQTATGIQSEIAGTDTVRFLEIRRSTHVDAALARTIPVLLDPDGSVSRLFKAAEPSIAILVDAKGQIRYRGEIFGRYDSSRVSPHLTDAITRLANETASPITSNDGLQLAQRGL